MIKQLDEVLQELLIHALPIRNGAVDIAFEQPKREWSARLGRPTLNLFLHDIRANKVLRQHDWQIKRDGNGGYTRRRLPVRLNLHYMVTAWAKQPLDEHRLLTQTLLALFRYPNLPPPKDGQPEEEQNFWQKMKDQWPQILRDQPGPISLSIAQNDGPHKPPDLWSALDNELRPAVDCLITLALNPYQEFTGLLVHSRDLQVGQADAPASGQQLDRAAGQDRFWMVAGRVHSDQPPESLKLTLLERGLDVPIRKHAGQCQYVIGNLESGDYTLEVLAEGRKPSQHTIHVPSEAYDIEL